MALGFSFHTTRSTPSPSTSVQFDMTMMMMPPPPQREQQDEQKEEEEEKLTTPSSPSLSSSSYYAYLLPPLYVSLRMMIAAIMPITDCDEVYNYWEPLHYMLYGTGQQTWEYAHQYALRTYAYLLPLQIVAQFGSFLPTSLFRSLVRPLLLLWPLTGSSADEPTHFSDKVLLWILMRAALAGCTAAAEWCLLRACWNPPGSLRLHEDEVSTHSVVLWTALLWSTATGLHHASGALLPSSTWMMVWCAAAACLIDSQPNSSETRKRFSARTDPFSAPTPTTSNASLLDAASKTSNLRPIESSPSNLSYPLSEHQQREEEDKAQGYFYHQCFIVVAVTATLATAWPFGAVVLMPMGLFVLIQSFRQGNLIRTLLWIGVVTALVQAGVMVVDHYHYGVWTSPTLNIFMYNAAGGGDALYGVEPTSYYVKNLFLNLNLMAVLGVWAGPVAWCSLRRQGPLLALWGSLWAWLAITVPRPHKEERFLFPIYPVLVYGAVWTVDATVNAVQRIMGCVSRHKQFFPWQRRLWHALIWVPVILFSLLRSTALVKYYTAPIRVYSQLSSIHQAQQHPTAALMNHTRNKVCTCGEWYRFPSSFFLPPGLELGFLPSSFKGQLPQPFSQFGSSKDSLQVLQPFNNVNQEQTERYVSNPAHECLYVVDLADSADCQLDGVRQQVVASVPFLRADRTKALHRILYLPFWHERAIRSGEVVYTEYVLRKVLMEDERN